MTEAPRVMAEGEGLDAIPCDNPYEMAESGEPTVIGYRAGEDRNAPNVLSHTYAMMSDGELWPMCGYGWNRSDGESYSIFRGSPGTEGDCKLCARNVSAKRAPVIDGFPHKTKWL